MKNANKQLVFLFLITNLILQISCREEIKDGIGEINYSTSSDLAITEVIIENIGKKVLGYCKRNPGMTTLKVNIIDVCEDYYGNKSKMTSTVICDAEDIQEYIKYADAASFMRLWTAKMILEWKPCGQRLLRY